MHIRPGLHVVQCSPSQVQIGTDPRWAIRLDNLSADEVPALIRLPRMAPAAVSAAVASLSPRLRLALVEGGILIADQPPAPAIPVPSHSAPTPDRSARRPRSTPFENHPDREFLGQTRADGDGAATLVRRAKRSVGIVGLGRTGLRIAQCLASAGITAFALDDDRPVRTLDVGLGGYTLRDLGRPRNRAAARLIADARLSTNEGPGATLFEPLSADSQVKGLDVVVMTGHAGLDPVWMWRLVSEQVPHLPIVWHEASVSVGPLVLPGRTPCLRCIDLTRRDDDAAWPVIAAQLNALALVPHAEETLLTATAAAVAVSQILALLDERASSLAGASFEILAPEGLPQIREWAMHPECGCAALPSRVGLPADRAPEPGSIWAPAR